MHHGKLSFVTTGISAIVNYVFSYTQHHLAYQILLVKNTCIGVMSYDSSSYGKLK
jgi:hypothetical protein